MGLFDKQETKEKNDTAKKDKPKVTYVCGCSPSVVKKFGEYEFGAGSVVRVKEDEKGTNLEMFIKTKPELWQIQKLESFLKVKVKVMA